MVKRKKATNGTIHARRKRMIIKTFSPNTNKLLLISISLLVFSLFTLLIKNPYMIWLGIISGGLAVIIAALSWTRSNWEYVGWDDPLFPDD